MPERRHLLSISWSIAPSRVPDGIGCQVTEAIRVCIKEAELLQSQTILIGGTAVHFATVEEAKEILTSRDDFVRSLSSFDRAARMKTDKAVSEKEYLEFVSTNVREWNDADRQKITSAFQCMQEKFEVSSFPGKVLMVKTTGDEEGRAAYTRANAMILPECEIAKPVLKVRKKICHELFHILTRANPELREKCYAIIGFVKCDELEFPTELKSRKITNPDAPANDHCILIEIHGRGYWAVPILFSNSEKYDTARGGDFFDYLQFQFLVTEWQNKAPAGKPVFNSLNTRLAELQQLSGFIEQVGSNTDYFIHPEEILADNFMLLISGERDVPSPEIIRKMEEVLK